MEKLDNRLKGKFSTIPNAIWEDRRIDAHAQAMLCYLLSKPDGWKVREQDVRKVLGIGRDKYQATMRLLRGCGYVLRVQSPLVDGKPQGTELIVLPDPTHMRMPEESGKCVRRGGND